MNLEQGRGTESDSRVRRAPPKSENTRQAAEQLLARMAAEDAQRAVRAQAEASTRSRESAERQIEDLDRQWDVLDRYARESAIVRTKGLFRDKIRSVYSDGVSTAFGDAVNAEARRLPFLAESDAAELVIHKGRKAVQERAAKLGAAGHVVPEFTLSRSEQRRQDEVLDRLAQVEYPRAHRGIEAK